MDFYTAVLRQSSGYWVALCLENGIVGQGETVEGAIATLKDAIASVESIHDRPAAFQSRPVPIHELHEFLTIESESPQSDVYELRTVHA